MNSGARGWLAWTVLGLSAAISWFALEQQKPVAAISADAPSSVFSSGRAMAIVQAIARAPHPAGSPENERVRGVLLKQLAELGLSAEIQIPNDKRSPVRNILVRLRGQGPAGKKALLLCAHYDTGAYSPGAGDDGSGVAVVLETLRAVQAGPPLDRDVIALIDDGEESGLLGAKLFVDEHPWAGDVGVVLNFDARGSSGPSFMFETSEGNGWLIRQFAAACPRPLASSMSMDVYPLVGSDTDLSIFKRAGVAGLNFAFLGGSANYHNITDNLENLDPRTIQHHGDNALAMTRHLGALALDDPLAEDVIYSSVLNRVVLFNPRSWSMPIALGVTMAFLVVLVVELWSRRMKLSDLGVGVLTWPIAAIVAIFVVHAFWMVLRDIMINVGLGRSGPFDVQMLVVCALIAAVIAVAVVRRVARRRSLEGLALGALTWWFILTIMSARWLPNSSYLFAWPTLFALFGLGGATLARPGSNAARVWILLASIPTLVVLPPAIRNIFDGLGLRLAGPVMILVVLFLGAILPVLAPLLVHSRRGVAAQISEVTHPPESRD